MNDFVIYQFIKTVFTISCFEVDSNVIKIKLALIAQFVSIRELRETITNEKV